ncbi:hypothetical protein [Acinetobacter baumannii]|uniref:hypothetical protein n=1 Tax=Acinetobacter baumannii TaxID=470 RepID=UPI00321BB81F
MTDLIKEREAFEAWFTTTDVYKRISHQIEMCGSGRHQDIFTVFQRDDWREENYAQVSVMASWLAWQEKAKTQAVPTWISVEDAWPPTDIMVLICWVDAPDVTPEQDYMTIDEDLNSVWANYQNDPPSHWMHFHSVPNVSGAEG